MFTAADAVVAAMAADATEETVVETAVATMATADADVIKIT